ncbi:hypothetical protein SAMN02745704_01178 [Paucidesulfovibrio gracilis DSM 16080]|uniref:SPW repeat-containing protein n=1 Tax=Paucidesulfovibrio gracilis DSM 16080 TaxID=1121449 RepID=A0A1T4WP91_9BACT|nr:hypothetical protein [Paucidesulfovibrio gracilis]SKA78688.1 hypothetical protein SAMN02745704_01178 [Paucidesulfovibrio gracilis DSM 16080]
MSGMNLERCGRAAWLLGLVGVAIWLPIVAWALLEAGDVTGGIVATAWFGAGVGLAWYLAPWRNKNTPLWKPLSICLGSVVIAATFFTYRYDLHEGQGSSFLWSMAVLLVMFLPAFLAGRKRWYELFPDQKDEKAR